VGDHTLKTRLAASPTCISAASAPLTVNAPPSAPAAPTITESGPLTFCAGGSVTLTSSPGTSYLWSTTATTPSINVTISGSYTVQVTNASGCQSVSSEAKVVTVNNGPSASVIAGTGSMCVSGSRNLTVTITGGTSLYIVVLSDGTTKTGYTNGSNISVSPSSTTTYTITSVTDANGCPSTGLSGSAIITVNALPTVNLGEDQTVCTGGSATFDAGPGFIAYAWSTGASTQTITVNTEGTYSVTVTDANNCQNSDEAELIINTIPEVVCLMDLSGSMSWDYYGDKNPPLNKQRIDYAKNALIAFTDLLYTNFPNCAYYGLAGFRGTSTFLEPLCNGYEFFPMSILDIINSGTLINTTIPSLFAEGSTPLLAGLDKAINMFVTNNKKSIVLLSDGVHNCPYEVGIDDPTLNSLIGECTDAGIKIYPIAFGQDYNINHALLQYLADQTVGAFYDVTVQHGKTGGPDPVIDPGLIADEWHPETALNIAYANILRAGLDFDYTLEPMGVIDHGEIKQIDVPVTLFDKKICFFTSWVTSQPDYLKIRIFSSDGAALPAQHPGITYSKRSNHTIVTISDKFLYQQGKVSTNPWRFEIDASDINPSENYQFMVLNKSKKLTLKTYFDKRNYYTGDKMKIFLELLVEGQRLTGLDGINITGTRPEDGLGNWLAGIKLTAQKLEEAKKIQIDQVTRLTLEHANRQNLNTVQKQKLLEKNMSSLMDNLTPAQLKAQIMMEEMKLKLPGRIAVRDFFFNDEGINGDETAGDGIYTAEYNKLAIEGSYFFNITVIDTSKGKNIRREAQMQKYVNANIRSKRFIDKVTLIDSVFKGNKVYLVTLKLKDKYGNVPSPSALFYFKLILDKGELLGKIQANPDGSFTQMVALPENVTLRNVKMTMKVYDQVGVQRLKPLIPSWIYMVIVILGLSIMGVYKRKRH
jgi:hypothetical protein